MKKYHVLAMSLIVLSMFSCQENKYERLERMTKTYSKRSCPKKMNDNITLDSVVFHVSSPDNYKYYYSVSADSILLESFDKYAEAIRPELLKSLNNSIEMRKVKDVCKNISHVFIDANTKHPIKEIKFGEKDF